MPKKYVMITGASSGIGRELAKLFSRDGYHLILVARRLDKLDSLANELSALHGTTSTVIAKDLTSPTAPDELFQTLKEQAIELDVLVNNAGLNHYGKYHEVAFTHHHTLLQTNLNTLVKMTHLALEGMCKRGSGKILNIGSTASFVPGPRNAIYCASKAFVLSFSEGLSSDLEGTGVTVTTLCPGATKSEFAEKANLTKAPLFNHGVMGASDVAAIGYSALLAGKRTIVAGLLNNLLVISLRFTPRPIALWMSKVLVG